MKKRNTELSKDKIDLIKKEVSFGAELLEYALIKIEKIKLQTGLEIVRNLKSEDEPKITFAVYAVKKKWSERKKPLIAGSFSECADFVLDRWNKMCNARIIVSDKPTTKLKRLKKRK